MPLRSQAHAVTLSSFAGGDFCFFPTNTNHEPRPRATTKPGRPRGLLTGHGTAGYVFKTMKVQVSVVRCEGYEYERVSEAVKESVGRLGGMGRFVKAGQKVLLKPNLLVSSTPQKGVTTHPMVVKAVIEMVKAAGGVPVVGDSPAVGTALRVAAKAGIAQVAEEAGCRVVDFREILRVRAPEGFIFRRFEVAREAVESDFVINLPKIKTHGQMLLTLGVKNMFGCVPGTRKAAWHLKAGVDRTYFARMLVELYSTLKPGLTVMDGIVAMEGNGPSSGTARPLGMILAGTDCVALDSTVTHILGLPRERLWTTQAAIECGIGVAAPELIEVLGPSLRELSVAPFKLPVAADLTWGVPGFIRGLVKDVLVPRPVIERSRCSECLSCVKVCPPGAMKRGAGGIVIDRDRCIRCFCCQEVCPEGAIEIRSGFLHRVLRRGRQ
ncbi:MAG: DUF362 domain-containing protein [Deltaproteobacteria bacterium]|nr:DUF362 domain-containing protein [Deltaproteobacteria bacterium]